MPPKPTPTQTALPIEDAATRIAKALSADRRAYETSPNKVGPYPMCMAVACLRALLAVEFPDQRSRPPKRAKTAITQWTGAVDDDAWLDQLAEEPAMRFIDVKKELGRCQFWCKVNGKPITRRRFTTWLQRADPTIGYDAAGKSSTDKKTAQAPNVYNEPPAWREILRGLGERKGWANDVIADACEKAWGEVSLTVRQEIIKALAA